MKKFLNLRSILLCVAVVFGLIAAFMLFAPAIVPQKGSGDGYKGSEIAFGLTQKGFGELKILGASAYMLPLFLAIIGVVLALIAMLGKGGKVVPVIAAVCFVGAAIVYFLPFQLINPTDDYLKLTEYKDKAEFVKDFKKVAKLGAGAIVGGVFALVATCASVVPVFLKND